MVRGAGSPRGRSGGGARGDAGGERRRYSGEGAPRVATSGRRCLTPRPRLAPPKRTATMGGEPTLTSALHRFSMLTKAQGQDTVGSIFYSKRTIATCNPLISQRGCWILT